MLSCGRFLGTSRDLRDVALGQIYEGLRVAKAYAQLRHLVRVHHVGYPAEMTSPSVGAQCPEFSTLCVPMMGGVGPLERTPMGRLMEASGQLSLWTRYNLSSIQRE